MENNRNVLAQLASSLGERGGESNLALAEHLAAAEDQASIQVLVDNLTHKSKGIASDCIKVLYEIGARKPALISEHLAIFLGLLTHRNNRLQWGAMTAIAAIAPIQPAAVFNLLPELMNAAEQGSVITRDQAVNILIVLLAQSAYAESVFPFLLEQLRICPPNQLPMYAERALPVIAPDQRTEFVQALVHRLPDLPTASKRKRVEQVIGKVGR